MDEKSRQANRVAGVRLIQTENPEKVGQKASEFVLELLQQSQQQPKPVSIVFPTGNTPLPMYQVLRHTPYTLWSNSHLFHLDEYVPPAGRHLPSRYETYEEYMKRELWDYVGGHQFFIGHYIDRLKEYDELARQNDGLDLVILGIGGNGHVAFNEPGSASDAPTRRIQLAPTTMRDNFGTADRPGYPTEAVTMGLGTILKAKHILLLATGEKKREILQKAFDPSTPPSADCPASWLKNHPNVTVITDFSVDFTRS